MKAHRLCLELHRSSDQSLLAADNRDTKGNGHQLCERETQDLLLEDNVRLFTDKRAMTTE